MRETAKVQTADERRDDGYMVAHGWFPTADPGELADIVEAIRADRSTTSAPGPASPDTSTADA